MDELTPKPAETPETLRSIGFLMARSGQFRNVHVDGAFGGVTPQGLVHVNLFSEHLPTPSYVEYEMAENGQVMSEVTSKRIGREGILRELEVGVFMTLEIAKSLRDFLSDKIKAIEEVTK